MATDHPNRHLRIVILVLLGAGLALGLGWLFARHGPGLFQSRESLEAFLIAQGGRAPIALMGLQFLQVVLAPIPGHLLSVVSGLAFGLWKGTLYTVVGVASGCAVVLVVARWLGRPAVERWAPRPALVRIDTWAARRGPLFFFLFFLLPFLPDDLACFAVGLSNLPLVPMFLLIVVARLPGHFASAWLGATATGLPLLGWILIIAMAAAVLALYWRNREAVERWLIARIEGPDRG